MPTIKDVAKKAGVSPSTVSRVVNNHPRISQETREEVLQAMDEIGYHPNVIAQNLVNQTTNTLGLVMAPSTEEAFADPFYAEVLRGIGSMAQKNGYSLLLITGDEEGGELEATLRAVRGKQVDGLLLLRAKKSDKLTDKLNEMNFPFVVVGRPEEEDKNYWVNNDNVQSSKELVEYLINLGHNKIGAFIGSEEYIVDQDRLKGYKLALKSHGIDYNQDYIVQIESGKQEKAYRFTKDLLNSYPELTALYGIDDRIAYGAIKAVKELGFKIPEDIAIVGFNNNPLSELIEPALTTVDINTYELGRKATSLLIQVITEQVTSYCNDIVPTDLIVRESCGGKND
ncbi:transcriptional regulator [Halobacteroides halobius DSM 5150]|uniref:Transcriptional regulator n=1 Tax=Halobacteroides halobius (strain ATCC 35273 / DSM 5150 / MD-1) TaxID=748449 RepID=L0K6V3_HALHC|nr:LacI family DNA-binding transcriptional regulator [Halobacteroides halobius]AGB40099.1 transcriptional regulator [Halobacteroides halobius DSM 5150]